MAPPWATLVESPLHMVMFVVWQRLSALEIGSLGIYWLFWG